MRTRQPPTNDNVKQTKRKIIEGRVKKRDQANRQTAIYLGDIKRIISTYILRIGESDQIREVTRTNSYHGYERIENKRKKKKKKTKGNRNQDRKVEIEVIANKESSRKTIAIGIRRGNRRRGRRREVERKSGVDYMSAAAVTNGLGKLQQVASN